MKNTATLSATIEQKTEGTWRSIAPVPPPQDRLIRIVANVACSDEFSTSVDPYEGLACWDERSQEWLDEIGMSVRTFHDAELIILEWSEANPERRFVIRREGAVNRLAPRRRALAALPAPAWHSTDPYRGGYEGEFRRWMDSLSSVEIFELLEIHDRFIRAMCGLTEWGEFDELTHRCVECPVLKSGAPDRDLSPRQREEVWAAAKSVEDRMRQILLSRYRAEIAKRSAASQKAARTRGLKAATAAAFDRESDRVGRPFRRDAR